MIRFFLPFLLSLLVSCLSVAQSPKALRELDSLKYYSQKIPEFTANKRTMDPDIYYDSLNALNELLMRCLYASATEDTSLFEINYGAFNDNGFSVVESPDRMIRSYSWDTWTGGSMVIESNLIQFKTSHGVRAKIFVDGVRDMPRSTMVNIFRVFTPTGTIYLCEYFMHGSGYDYSSEIVGMKISGDTLVQNIPLFRNGHEVETELSIEYHPRDERDYNFRSINYNPYSKVLEVPAVGSDGYLALKFDYWDFNGRYFEKRKAAKAH